MKRYVASKLLLIDGQTWKDRQSLDFSKMLVLKIASALGSLILLIKLVSITLSSRSMDPNYLAQLILFLTLLLIHFGCRNLRTVRMGSLCLMLSLTLALTVMLIASAGNMHAAAYHYVPALLLFAGFQLNLRTVFALFVHFATLYILVGLQVIPPQESAVAITADYPAISIDRLTEWIIITLFIGLYHRLKERQYKIISEHERSHSHKEKLLSISRMAAGIAHEINNPLAIIVGYVEILAMGNKVKPLNPKVYPRMLEACDRIAVIVKGILELSQDKLNLAEDIHLTRNLQNHLAEISQRPSLKQVASRLEELNFQMKLPPGVWDPIVKAVVQNAFEAAVQQQSPQVEISFVFDESGLSLIIADNGPPFDERNINQFFEPFYTSKFDSHGRGLGLTVAHVLATRMGWTIKIKREGTWTKVEIVIPRSSIQNHKTMLPEAS